jgi:hypothetical protein
MTARDGDGTGSNQIRKALLFHEAGYDHDRWRFSGNLGNRGFERLKLPRIHPVMYQPDS